MSNKVRSAKIISTSNRTLTPNNYEISKSKYYLHQSSNNINIIKIDENSSGMNDMLLWVKSARVLIKRAEKGLKNDISNLLNTIR